MARRLLSTIPCPRMHAPADIIPSTYDSTPARPRLQPYTPPTYTPPRSCLHAPARQPPCRFTLLPPRLSIRLSAPPHMHTHMHTCTRLSAGRFVGGRYTPLPGGPGGAADNAPSRPGTTVNSFCDAPHGLECGGLCWGSDVRARSVLHGGIMRLHSALHSIAGCIP